MILPLRSNFGKIYFGAVWVCLGCHSSDILPNSCQGSGCGVFRVVGETLAVEKQLASGEASQKKCTTSEKQLYFLDKTKGFPL